MEKDYAIEMVGISKRFGGTYALKNITLQVKHGECHALVGENGAGNPQCMKILAVRFRKDPGKFD